MKKSKQEEMKPNADSKPASEKKPSLAQAFNEWRKETHEGGWSNDLKPALQSLLRQGASELGNAIVPAFPDSLKPVEVSGGVGNPTQAELSQERGLYGYKQNGDMNEPNPEKEKEIDYEP